MQATPTPVLRSSVTAPEVLMSCTGHLTLRNPYSTGDHFRACINSVYEVFRRAVYTRYMFVFTVLQAACDSYDYGC